jgi:hypothetical protein
MLIDVLCGAAGQVRVRVTSQSLVEGSFFLQRHLDRRRSCRTNEREGKEHIEINQE